MDRSRSRGWWIAGAALLAASCGQDQGAADDDVATVRSALTVPFTIPIFVGSNPMDFALGASRSLSINDRASVREIGIGVQDLAFVSNLGDTLTDAQIATGVGVSAQVGTILSRRLVSLRSNAKVVGSIYQGANASPVEQTGVTVSGITKVNVDYVVDTTWQKSLTWPTTFNPTPNLEPGQQPTTVPLTPGGYHTVDVKTGRILRLSAGEYFLDNLTIEPGAFLAIDGSAGPVYVYILDGGFTFRGQMRDLFTTTPPLSFASFTIMTTGSVSVEAPFTGTIIALGSLSLRSNPPAGYIGQYFGRDVTLFEGNTAQRRADPFSFAGFLPGPNGIGDRTRVTGGSVRLPGRDITDEAHQSESVTAISRNGSNFVVTVGYNDQTIDPLFPTIIYTDFTVTGDPRDGTGRLITKGQTLMGWSYSTNGGRTFTYGGRVKPPTGWSLIWGDPAITKVSIDDPNVYYAQIAGTTAAFEATWDPSLQAIVSSGQNIANALNGYCISRSTDRGVTFNAIGCVNTGFQDGTAVAVAMDQANRHEVYVGGTGNKVSRMDGESMTFSTTAIDPPIVFGANQFGNDHPRMRVNNGILYYARAVSTNQGSILVINRLNAATNATTWLGQATVMCGANPCRPLGGDALLATGKFLAAGPTFSFDFGQDTNGQQKLRVAFTAQDGAFNGPNLRAINVAECDLDVTNCRLTGWSTNGDVNEEINPSIRFSGGRWVVTWRKIDPGTPNNTMRHVVGHMNFVAAQETLQQKTLYPGVIPCVYNITDPGFLRLGEYDLIDGFGDGRFFAPYSTSGPGGADGFPVCRWQGEWTSDAHVGGSVFSF